MDILKYEKSYRSKGYNNIVGIDEAGRGPLAGPVVSCGCYFKNYSIQNDFYELIRNSKKLSPKKRD